MLRALSFAARRPALSITTRRTTLAVSALRPLRAHLVLRDFAVAVLVELLQGGGCVGDFRRINHAVVVGIERLDHRRHRRTAAVHSLSTRSLTLALPRRTISRRRSAGILRVYDKC